jgi:hypothetical protein
MHTVFVNHCHPDTPHICATRMREFAAAMAARGHHIVLLTETLLPGDAAIPPDELPALLDAHDWSHPFTLACPPRPAALTERLQNGTLSPVASKPMVLWCYLAKGGVFWTWVAGSRPYWETLADHFRPDVTWATFGNVDALNIARGIAGIVGCPWVIDAKDFWSVYLPAPLRALIARRYADAAAMTALSDTNLHEMRPWFTQPGTVVYSGYPASHLAPPAPEDDGLFRLMLTGSIYDDALLAMALDAFAAWLKTPGAPSADAACFCYAGGDHARAATIAKRLDGVCRVEIEPYLTLEELFARQCRAGANLYLRGRTFHHKLIELLAARRPIIAVPSEGIEAAAMAQEAGVLMYECADAATLTDAFAAARAAPSGPLPANMEALARLTWAGQAETLETVLMRAATGGRRENTGQSAAPGL